MHETQTQPVILMETNYSAELHQQIMRAEQSIDTAMYLIAPPPRDRRSPLAGILDAMRDASGRGIRCRLVIAAPTRRHPDIELNARSCDYLRDAGWNIRHANTSTTMHTKLWVFDHTYAIIGSHNISTASLLTNLDTSLLIHSTTIAARLSTRFAALWTNAQPERPDQPPNG